MNTMNSFHSEKMAAQKHAYGEHLPRLVDLLSGLTKNIAHETNNCSINFMTHLTSIEAKLIQERARTEDAIGMLGGFDEVVGEHQRDQERLESDLQRAIEVGDSVRQEIEATRHAMVAIAQSIEGMRQELREVENFSREIKMIAINASIASARAGQAGKEFSVISTEVRRLAAETESVTERLAPLIQGALKELHSHAATGEDDETGKEQVDVLESLGEQSQTLKAARHNLAEVNSNYQELLNLNHLQHNEKKRTQQDIEDSIRNAISCAQSGDVIRQQAETIDEMLQELSQFIRDSDLNADIRAGVDKLIDKLSSKYVMYSQRRVHTEEGHSGDDQWNQADGDLKFELF